MRLDGELFSLAGGYLACDEPDVLATRVGLVLASAPSGLRDGLFIVDRLSAAWAWGALTVAPEPAELCCDVAARSRTAFRGHPVHQVRLRSGDVLRTAAGPVLSRWRTIVHLLRWPPTETTAELAQMIGVLLAGCGLTVAEARERLRREHVPSQAGRLIPELERICLPLSGQPAAQISCR